MRPPAVEMRPARPGDMPFIRECIERFRLDDENLEHRQFVVAVEGNEIVGFGRIRPHREVHDLGSVGVVEHRRNQGIGALIVENLIGVFPAPDIYITTDMPGYFQRFGFQVIAPGPRDLVDKLNRVCKSKCREGAVVMVYRKQG